MKEGEKERNKLIIEIIFLVVRDGIGGCPVPGESITHHLENNLTSRGVGVTPTTMLVGPRNLKIRSFDEHIAPHVVPATIVVLRIKQTVSVGSVTIGFIQTVVGTTRDMEIHITHHYTTHHSYKQKEVKD